MDLSRNCQSLLARVENLPDELIEIIRSSSNSTFLPSISSAAQQPALTEPLFQHLRPLAVELFARWSKPTSIQSLAAFGRVVTLIPQLSGPVLQLLSRDGDNVDLLHHLPSLQPGTAELGEHDTRELLLGVLRLVTFDNANYARLLRPAKLQLYLASPHRSLRYLAVRILCAFAGASDAAMEQALHKHLGDEEISGKWEDKIIDYKFWPLWEERRQKDFQARQLNLSQDTATTCSRIINNEDLSSMVTELAGLLFVKRTLAQPAFDEIKPIVSTSTTHRNLHRFANALQAPGPVLLTGLAGSGKTHLVNHVSNKLGHGQSMVTLHLNEQTDAKLLVGIYATGSTPGSFEWRPGVLTTAVREGRWVFIEDLDRAPSDVLSTILPLIERRQLLIPSRGESVQAAAGFRILATMRTHVNLRGEEVTSKPGMLGERLWSKVHIERYSIEELQQLAVSRNPLLKKYIDRLLAVYQALDRAFSATTKNSRTAVSPRDLLKWCDRVTAYLTASGISNGTEVVDDAALDAMFLDGIDCFAGHLDDPASRSEVAALVAQELHIDPQRRDHLLYDRGITKPRISADRMIIGRAKISAPPSSSKTSRNRHTTISNPFALNKHSMRLLERVAMAVRQREPILLVGETGIGKTTVVQHLADLLGQQLLAINLSQQSESGDLLGGFKPVSIRSLAVPLRDEFDFLFDRTFSNKKNQNFAQLLGKCIAKGQWKRALSLWREALKMVDNVLMRPDSAPSAEDAKEKKTTKRRKLASSIDDIDRANWKAFTLKLDALESQISASSSHSLTFSFTEGKLVKAVRDGHWVLLDEINLATPDTLECLSDLLESGPDSKGSLLLAETGSVDRIVAHADFRIFGAMNPSNDVGKKDLPPGIKSRFTELYVDSPDKDAQSLQEIVAAYLGRASGSATDARLAALVTEMYLDIQRIVQQDGLVDGSGQRPVFSLRTLTRTLTYAVDTTARGGVRRALYEGFALCFFTCLDGPSEQKLQTLVKTKLFGTLASAASELKKSLRQPEDAQNYTQVTLKIHSVEKGKKDREERCWVPKGEAEAQDPPQYIITQYIGRNLQNLVRAASSRKYPVLIQGPTSAGKTSMVEYLAQRSGNTFVRINNHEHTDLQEYLGTYVSTQDGQIVFQEGVLVEALRKGYWVVLDELNLAPTDVLEALNRLLDENRELLIPETQEIVRPHPNFMLFATQNPAGPYGGRKALSRAFRNRFLELHFDDIPIDELQIILARRANLPESRCALIVEVYKKLSQLRQESRVFEQHSFATLRDLFRWAFRDNDTIENLATNGYMLLAEKVRKADERLEVKKVIESTLSRKGVKINISENSLYDPSLCPAIEGVVWTKSMSRLYALVKRAVDHGEPVLLVGETGCGKTTICQMLAPLFGKQLHIVNAHQNLETGDIIGAQRPTRNRAAIEAELKSRLEQALAASSGSKDLSSTSVDDLYTQYSSLEPDRAQSQTPDLKADILSLRRSLKALFEWQDGTIVQAMRSGDFFLLDEISLADDSVLERLNSVLDPQRTILLAEKGSKDSLVTAADSFRFFATMNPGGDYGKKELSPALRNRFTEIWVPPMSDMDDCLKIVEQMLSPNRRVAAPVIVAFGKWYEERFHPLKEFSISLRDMLAWISFINTSTLDFVTSIVHGAAMVYIDTLGANPSALLAISGVRIEDEKAECLSKLGALLDQDALDIYRRPVEVSVSASSVTFGPFSIARVGQSSEPSGFTFDAPTSKKNAMRIVRGLQLNKPILLEGSPGVGKTSLVAALAHAVGKPLTRLNLSEQTDLMDLFGSDVPVDNAEAGNFAWRDASFLAAMKSGGWVLLDEMNLASQSILEGLNACLDHRGEVYIPELDMVFKRHPDFRLFAAQNPHSQGGGRKGLPSSFVNRFTVVYADVLDKADLYAICEKIFPHADLEVVQKLVAFVDKLDVETTQLRRFGQRGAPWEFNLRDTLRCLQLLTASNGLLSAAGLQTCVDLLFAQRFRSEADSGAVQVISQALLGLDNNARSMTTNLSSGTFQVGVGLLEREGLTIGSHQRSSIDLNCRRQTMEAMMVCVQQNWPVLLVGASASGKSRLIESLAATTGRNLEVFPLSADIDATDLVGGYEQVDITRSLRSLAKTAAIWAREFLATLVMGSNDQPSTSAWADLASVIRLEPTVSTDQDAKDLLRLISNIARVSSHSTVHQLKDQIEQCIKNFQSVNTARFQWVDGSLVNALEKGHWLVLDNANLCSPSVLDRLNSLLEPNGSLIISEHCSTSGDPKIVQPHPDFRIFLTMDPQHGEISRAMRNRAVEIYLPPNSKGAAFGSATLLESSLTRFHQVSHLSELENGAVVQAALQQLAYHDVPLLSRFSGQAQLGLISESFREACIENCDRMLETTNGQSWYKLPREIYTSVVPFPEFIAAQSLNTLSNEAVLISAKTDLDAYWLSTVHETLMTLTQMSHAMVSQQIPLTQQSVSKDVHQLTKLQLSFSSNSSTRTKQDCTAGVAGFLSKLLAELSSSITGLHFPHDAMSKVRNWVNSVLFYWHIIFQMVSSQEFDEAKYVQVLTHAQGSLSTSPPGLAIDSQLVRRTIRQFDAMGVQNKSQTGLSMPILWTLFRPTVAPDFLRHTNLLRLEGIADRFDEAVWQSSVPLKNIVNLQRGIRQAISLLLERDIPIDALASDVEDALQKLSGETHRQQATSNFRDAFKSLLQCYSLRKASRQCADDFSPSDLARLLAGLPTKVMVAHEATISPAESLYAISRYTGTGETLQTPFHVGSGGLGYTTLNRLKTSSSVNLQSLTLFQAEIDVLGSEIAANLQFVCIPHSLLMHRFLEFIRAAVDSAHRHDISQLDFAGPHDQKKGKGSLDYSSLKNDFLRPISEDPNCFELGQQLMAFSIGCLFLYVPERPFDPALPAIVSHELHLERQLTLTRTLHTLKLLENSLTGVPENLRTRQVEADLLSLGSPPPLPKIPRPIKSRIMDLQPDFSGVLRIIDRAKRIEVGDSTNSEDHQTLILDIGRAVDRLHHQLPVYRDITEPLIGLLNCLRLGVSICESALKSKDKSSTPFSSQQVLSMIPLVGNLPLFLRSRHAELGGPLEEQRSALLAFGLDARVNGLRNLPSSICDKLTASFSALFQHEQMQVKERRAENADAERGHRFRGDAELELEDDEDEFQSLFPSYEGAEMNTSPHLGAQIPSDLGQLAVMAANLHVSIFLGTQPVEDMLDAVVTNTTERMISFKEDNQTAENHSEDPFLFLSLLGLSQKRHELVSPMVKPSQYNIYADQNILETSRASILAQRMLNRTEDILKVWPEHATLHNIVETCNDILSVSYTAPIMKILLVLEKLHAYLAQWQTVASREFSVENFYNDTTQTIVSWRRLELSTWAHLLDLEAGKTKDQAYEFWFMAYNNVIHIPWMSDPTDTAPDQCANLLSALEIFLIGSPVGQFGHRVGLLESLLAHVGLLASSRPFMQTMLNGLHNLINHYKRFQLSIDRFVTEGRQKLEKDLKEVVQLASWKDTNIESLKQSSRNSHRKLFRVVKKFREHLAKPASPLLTPEAGSMAVSEVITSSRDVDHIRVDEASIQSSLVHSTRDQELWSARPTRYKNLEATLSMMQDKTAMLETSIDAAAILDDFGEVTQESADQLRKVTPSTATKENANVVKHLTVRKRRLLADTLKEIRRMGIITNQAPIALKAQDSVAKVLATLPVLNQSDQQLHYTLDMMSKIRESLNEHSEDLTASDVSRCVGSIEGMLTVSIEQRKVLARHISHSDRLDATIDRVASLWSSDGPACSPVSGDARMSRVSSEWSGWMIPTIGFGVRVLEAQVSFGTLDFSNSSILQDLPEWARKFESLQARFATSRPTLPGLRTSDDATLLQDVTAAREAFRHQLGDWKEKYPQASIVLGHLQRWVTGDLSLEAGFTKRDFETPSTFDTTSFHSTLFTCLDYILAAIQNVEKQEQSMPISSENPGWLVQAYQAHRSVLSAYHAEAILVRFDEAVSMISHIEDADTLSTASATVVSILPLVMEYQQVYRSATTRFEKSYISLTKTLYRFTKLYAVLSASGFCKPAEPSDSKGEGTEKLEGGTGLGEGEGAENISKDIGDDEDLDELAQEEGGETNPDNEGDGNDDAVSIDGDMKNQSKMEDAGEEGEEQDGKEQREEVASEDKEDTGMGDDGDAQGTEGHDQGESNMEEGVGDVDDLEPSAIDEKMWDQAADEQLKEKEGKQDAKSKDKSNQAASNEDTGNKEEEGEAGGNDQHEEKDEGDSESIVDDFNEQGEDAEDIDGAGAPDMAEAINPNLKETENLDLPDDMQLDGDKGETKGDDAEEMFEDFPDDQATGAEAEQDEPLSEDLQAPEQEGQDKTTDATELPQDEDKDDGLMDVNDNTNPTEGDNGEDEAIDQGTGGEQGASDVPQESHEQQTASGKDDDSNADPQASMTKARGGKKSQAPTSKQNDAEEQTQSDPTNSNEESLDRDNERDRFKKLGNILEQWHRQQREIQEASSTDQGQQEQQDVEMADADFEHLPDDDAKPDTQALGASTHDDAKALDQDLALPSTDEKTDADTEGFEADEEDSIDHEDGSDQDNDQNMGGTEGDASDPLQNRTKIGSPRPPQTGLSLSVHPDEDEIDPTSDQLSTLDIRATNTPSRQNSRWATYESKTSALALSLTEQLRLILTPTLATKLRGDFRTGKRLNIKRIIPYIASSYKRDKIWMRRSIPSKRAYQILLCIDDSKSMKGLAADLAFETLALVGRALSMLEVGEIGVLSFGQDVSVAHALGQPFTSASGEQVLSYFAFDQQKTDVRRLISSSIEQLREARNNNSSQGGADLWQLQLVISDGICEDHEGIRRLLLRAQEERIMVVFVVVDAPSTLSSSSIVGQATAQSQGKAKNTTQSITDLEKVEFLQGPPGEDGSPGDMKVVRTKYLETFPFGYYLIVKDVAELPGVLSAALRQWFAEVAER